jgi:hypothetical protein
VAEGDVAGGGGGTHSPHGLPVQGAVVGIVPRPGRHGGA